jgi:transcriptional regulator with XRE-family HTH domain
MRTQERFTDSRVYRSWDGLSVSSESTHFSSRLQKALKDAGYSAYGPTELAYQFNVRFAGHPVSVHAARKWLMGEAIPTQDKIRVLSEWLMVPTEWLRFGGNYLGSEPASLDNVSHAYSRLVADIQKLDSYNRKLVFDFVRLVSRLNDGAASSRSDDDSSSPE